MTNNIITKYEVDKAGTIFASAFVSKEYKLSNYKYVDFVIAFGEGEDAQVKVQIFGKYGESEKEQAFRQISESGLVSEYIDTQGVDINVGGSGGISVFRITVDNLAKDGLDSVVLKLTPVSSSQVVGSITTVSYEPRYSE